MNLDAELELARPDGYARSPRMRARLAERGAELVASFVDCFGVEADLAEGKLDASWTGQAWCPTPSAHAALSRCGASKLHGPAFGVIARVNHRAFAAGLSQSLPGSRFVTTMAELDAMLSRDSEYGFFLKRPFGFAGRSCKRVGGPLQRADRTWAEASMRDYGSGLQVEPYVDIELLFSMHGLLAEPGATTFGPLVAQLCDQQFAWIGQRPIETGELTASERSALASNAATVASALRAADYFGPFSIDGYVWRSSDGQRRLQPLSDLNARYTMGFFEAMAGRPEVLEFLAATRC